MLKGEASRSRRCSSGEMTSYGGEVTALAALAPFTAATRLKSYRSPRNGAISIPGRSFLPFSSPVYPVNPGCSFASFSTFCAFCRLCPESASSLPRRLGNVLLHRLRALAKGNDRVGSVERREILPPPLARVLPMTLLVLEREDLIAQLLAPAVLGAFGVLDHRLAVDTEAFGHGVVIVEKPVETGFR